MGEERTEEKEKEEEEEIVVTTTTPQSCCYCAANGERERERERELAEGTQLKCKSAMREHSAPGKGSHSSLQTLTSLHFFPRTECLARFVKPKRIGKFWFRF